MKPEIKEFKDEEQLHEEIRHLKEKGLSSDHMYIVGYDEAQSKRIAEAASANTIGVDEVGLAQAVENLFQDRAQTLRSNLKELGFTEDETLHYEKMASEGKILLLLMDAASGAKVE
ncbi:general stress protein [Bacillus lacus]|uniref:General stress protein n=1 Tax=Metabacillus lacus TaxID=1983721 RepID=A0A7X2IWU7_9BACI|nr:general stress protein [Metabacillus lacus]MRX71144.1 general stress protein [Metabacillus lacus]